MDRNLALEFARVTEAAAIASARWMGLGDRNAADQAAVDAMRKALDKIHFEGTVVIGEGERDEAPMLYIGEKVGARGPGAPKIDLALDPLEGTNLCALGHYDSITVIAAAENGSFLHAPDTYMDKVAVGSDCRGRLKYEMPTAEKLKAVAECKQKPLSDVTVVVLDRPRHEKLIAECRASGVRIKLIGDGDVSAAVSAAMPGTGVDILLGTGGAPEGVIAAAALRCLDGDFLGKLMWRNDNEKERAAKMGIRDLDRVYGIEDLARGHVMFSASGVTDGSWLDGVHFNAGGCTTNSIVMRSQTRTIREIRTRHVFESKPGFEGRT